MKPHKHSFLKIILPLVPVTVIAGIILYCINQTQPVTKSDGAESVRFEVPFGTSVHAVAQKLKAQRLIKNERLFYLCARFPLVSGIIARNAQPFSLKSGVYPLSPSMSLAEILDILSSGHQEYIRISIPEGLTLSKIAERLAEHGVCPTEEFMQAARSKTLLAEYKLPAESFEGFLFPDTYFLNPSMSGEKIVRVMADNFFEKIKAIPNFSTLSSEELVRTVTLASIIEREYRVKDEAPYIASVFTNRLKKNIGLYSCATIEYILTEIQGKPHPDVITYADLAIDSPYNTYKWAGLPPGPISNPGTTALDAARNPAVTNYYFFRLVDAENGRHVFTKDFSTHISEGYISNTKKSWK